MIFRIQFSERAKPEIQEAYDWYENQQDGLGEKFLSKLDETFDLISIHPYSFPKKRDEFRECYLGDFPFLIVYEVKGKNIYVQAIFHTSRNPKKKKQHP